MRIILSRYILPVIIILTVLTGSFYLLKRYSRPLVNVNILTHGSLIYLKRSDLVNILRPVSKQSWYAGNLHEIVEKVSQFPGVKSLIVRKRWPQNLVVNISSDQPVAFWGTKNHVLLENGKIITPRYFKFNGFLPVYVANVDQIDEIKTRYQKLLEATALAKMPFKIIKVVNKDSSMIIVTSSGISITLPQKKWFQHYQNLLNDYQSIQVPKGQHISKIDTRYQQGFAVLMGKQASDLKNSSIKL